jgi:hypothetical protein
MRYQAQAERHYRRAVEEFDRLKALREVFANEIAWPGNLATPGDENSPLQRHRTFNNLRVFSEEPIFEGIIEAQPEQKEPLYTPFQVDPFSPENPAPAPDPPAPVPEPNLERAGDSALPEAPPPEGRRPEGAPVPPIVPSVAEGEAEIPPEHPGTEPAVPPVLGRG